ncbi:hypothetical protein IFM89_026513 [Coptis chinensis]|uniref:Late embryogenesis abundant protein LEA-2 subgroup domain-containing protein n=1 Tax=Coptis chinensis TaxID=261450 RepID=A0A835H7X2_9MAGN|nr:hypothetical protein IFM89_026513 [Coptis chinensis]
METGKKSRRCLKLCCAWTALVLGILIITLVILYFTVLKPKQPQSIAYPATLKNIEFSIFPALKLNITFGFVVTIINQNYGSFAYKNATAYVSYRGGLVGEAPIIGDKMPARGRLNISSTIEITADKLIINPNFWMDVNSGSLNFSSSTNLKGKVNAFNIFKKQVAAQRKRENNKQCYDSCNEVVQKMEAEKGIRDVSASSAHHHCPSSDFKQVKQLFLSFSIREHNSDPYPEVGRCFGSIALGTRSNDQDSLVWQKERTRLLAKRASPALVAAKGKIYVFGYNLFHPQPWAEVFDPELNTCTPLAEPPRKITQDAEFVN